MALPNKVKSKRGKKKIIVYIKNDNIVSVGFKTNVGIKGATK